MYLYMLLVSFIFSCSNGTSCLWQMVHTCTGDFDLDVPEGSGARRGASPIGLRGPTLEAPPSPLPPLPPVSIEQLVAT
jgi:hypothetical protein